jgi:hypothetical protein
MRTPFALVASACLAACSPITELEPAESAHTVGRSAVSGLGGVRVRAEWGFPGAGFVTSDVTPLKITILNGGAVPVRVSNASFVLRSRAGKDFLALAPARIRGTGEQITLVEYEDPMGPRASTQGFAVSSPYGPVYPGARTTTPLDLDPFYYETTYPYWERRTVPLPTDAMMSQAFPEGVIEPEKSAVGYVYFASVPEDVGQVDLRVRLVHATTGAEMGTVTIPFETD